MTLLTFVDLTFQFTSAAVAEEIWIDSGSSGEFKVKGVRTVVDRMKISSYKDDRPAHYIWTI